MLGPQLVEDKKRLLSHLYATIFLSSMAYGTVTFLTPVYAEGLGASYVDLGIIGAVGSVLYTVMTFILGVLLDRFDRVRVYLAFNILGVIVVALFCLAVTVPQVIFVRGLLGVVAAAFWVTASTLTANISPPEILTQSVGRYNLAWIAGFFVGPFIGGLISEAYGFRSLFLILSAIVILSVVIVLMRLTPNLVLRDQARAIEFDISSIRHLFPAYVALFPFSIVLGIYMAILPGHMKTIGIASSAIGLLLTMTNGVRGVGFLSTERLVNWGTKKLLFTASLLLCGAFYMISFSKSPLEFTAPLLMYGLAAGIMTPVILNYIAHRTPRKALGRAMDVHEGVYGIGMSIGPLTGGAIAEVFSPSTLYLILAFTSLIIMPLSFRLGQESLDPR